MEYVKYCNVTNIYALVVSKGIYRNMNKILRKFLLVDRERNRETYTCKE